MGVVFVFDYIYENLLKNVRNVLEFFFDDSIDCFCNID